MEEKRRKKSIKENNRTRREIFLKVQTAENPPLFAYWGKNKLRRKWKKREEVKIKA